MTKREKLQEKLNAVAVDLIDMEKPAMYKKLGFKRYYKRLEKLDKKFHKLELQLELLK